MGKKPETLLKERAFRDLDKLAREVPLWYEKIQQVAIRGTPDTLLCVAGVFIAIEFKDDGARPRKDEKLQEYKRDNISSALGYAGIVTQSNWKEVLEEIKAIGRRNLLWLKSQQKISTTQLQSKRYAK